MSIRHINRLTLVLVAGAMLLLGSVTSAQGDRGQRGMQRQPAQGMQQGDRNREREERRERTLQQQRLRQYDQQRKMQDQVAQQRLRTLQTQKRQNHVQFLQQYQERLRQDQASLQGNRNYQYSRRNFRYSRAGRSYTTDQSGAEMLRRGVNLGYQEGVRAGQADRQDRARFNYRDSYPYQDASYGYTGYNVDLTEYRYYFRQGFTRGYQDGFYDRWQYGTNSNGAFSLLGNLLQQIFNVTEN